MELKKKVIEGIPMYLNMSDHGISRRLYNRGKREECFMWLLRQARGDLAIDVGGNIGYCTLSLAKNFKKVIAVEPDPRSRKILGKNINLNKLKNVDVYGIAFSNKVGEMRFGLARKPNMSSFGRGEKKTISVDTTTIDGFVKEEEYESLFIKMDVEGHELNVIEGALVALGRAKHAGILMEIHPSDYSEVDYKAIMSILVGMGFSIPWVISAGVEKKGFRPPKLFVDAGYKPYKEFKGSRRAIYKDIDIEHAIDWASREIHDGSSKKIVRGVYLEK